MPEIPAPATEPASKAVGSQREIGSVGVGAVPRGASFSHVFLHSL